MGIQFNPFQELTGALAGYAAATSPANQGGIPGFLEAATNPGQVLHKQRISDVLAQAQPAMESIYQAAAAGDTASAIKQSTSLTGQLLSATGDPKFVESVMTT